MLDARAIQKMSRRLESAAAAQDWAAVSSADREVAGLLRTANDRSALQPSERAALMSLRKVHDDALAQCIEAGERIAIRIAELGSSREGWLAYAHDHDLSGALS